MLVVFQEWMARLLQTRTPNFEEASRWVKPGPVLSPEKRIAIYNEQVWLRFFHLLQKDYPSLTRLFGPADFNTSIAAPYLQAHFPTHPSLALLGATLPSYLAAHYREDDRRLILPIACLDEAYQRLKNAFPLPPLDASRMDGPLALQPTIALFELEADLFAFRTALLQHPPEAWIEQDFPSIDWGAPRHYLLSYQNDSFHIEALPPAAFRLLSALQQGARLQDAIASLTEEEGAAAAPHLFSWFQRWCSLGWLTFKQSRSCFEFGNGSNHKSIE